MRTVMYTPMAGRPVHSPDQEVHELDHPNLIMESHTRSKAYGIDRDDIPDFSPESPARLAQGLDENKFLLEHAMPVMETLHEQIANTHNMVLLTASNGLVLHSLGDMDFLEKAMQVALVPGVCWSEKSKGTNAIGTALTEELPVTIRGSEHFMHANQFLTCSCAPVFDPYGQIIGALDVTGDQRNFHQHTMALVRMSVQMIENHMFADIFPTAVRIHFHTRSEFLGTLVEGIAVFSHEGRFLSANRSAQFQLGMSFNALKGHTFSSLFDIPISRLHELRGNALTKPQQFVLHNGVSVWCRIKMKPLSLWSDGQAINTAASNPFKPPEAKNYAGMAPAAETGFSPARKVQLSTLHYLNTGDPQVATVIQKLSMVRGRDIPIMILGETGTGKDLLAQAIHGDSDRAGHPFVSVNCASIPETLIESELFGYEEGAFTGAKKKGATGKIQQANGGTLFLDEIGDMPRHLQARLLRVLQDKKVSPLGAGREVEVDVAVICATNKNLKEMIVRGEFREDLYYRLNGLVVRLPALRHRTDFEVVMQKILKSLCENGAQIGISADVMTLFHTHQWPGNFRQLHNLLRTAVVMVGCEGVIQRNHLPDDFLEEHEHVLQAVAQPSPSSAAAPENAMPNMPGDTDGQRLQDVALVAMTKMLQHHKGNVSAAAKALGVSRNTVYRRKEQLPPDVWN
ncbi:sigma-54-dependent Fis family transcriptional regulator [Polaromonas naphthalenivorans]|uniref:GAF modulated sigma54 specific transcriptional regulator, Fis family n=1 Tax=Polaromonas naphthalenivorans (strain CJ2) TaxID=365044 RepID=A1VK76_POLNA|nr:sigma-54-dependent Fis family transcriptional regulator [Polaromonas naphthalenivorans]ABM36054.1 GAF modulated sigma54 specific transcriptional regulator, Fis family [Polaromonas naphthalenivorans CJ2]